MDTVKKLFADAKFCTALFDAVTGIIFILVAKFDPADSELVKQVFFLTQPLFISVVGALFVQEKSFAAKIAVLKAEIAAQAK